MASQNRTITLNDDDIKRLKPQIAHYFALDYDIIDKIIQGDTMKILGQLPPQLVDCVFVDPPYNMAKIFNKTKFGKMKDGDYEEWLESWVRQLPRIMKPNASIYICGDWVSSSAIYRVLGRYFTIQNRITFEREKGRGAKRNWKNASEDIWFATNGDDYYFNVDAVKLKRKVIAPYKVDGKPKDWEESEGEGGVRLTYPSNIWTDITIPFWSMPENTNHPTQKPEKLLAKILMASTRPGDVVLDCFAGSGTTAVVAKKLQRHYITIDIDEEYCMLAMKRCEMASQNPAIQGYDGQFFYDRNWGNGG